MQISNEDNLTTELLYKNRNVSILFSYKNDDEKKQIETDIQQIIQYVIEDVDKITPYIDIDTKVNIWLGYKNNGPLAMAKADKYGIITQTINCFNIDIDSKYLTVQNHEFGHVIDKVGTREQLSKKPEFNQILKAYKKEYKSHMKTENRPDLIKDQYRNGGAPSEVFAQLCEKWLTEKEDLNLSTLRYPTIQAQFINKFYDENKETLERYFDDVVIKDPQLDSSDFNTLKDTLTL